MLRVLRLVLLVLGVAILVGAVYLTFRPLDSGVAFESRPQPTTSREAALARFEAGLSASDGPAVDPRCRSVLLEHGTRTDTVVVLFHGYTNCPYGFSNLAQAIYDQGINVLVPRLPHHGLLDRFGPAGHQWTAEELVRFADDAIDVAAGLGDRIVLGGLSAGGAVATWVAQNRADVDTVIALQPFLGLKYVPTFLAAQLTNAFETMPDSLDWWDGRQASIPPDYGYPKRSTRAVAELLRLGVIVVGEAERGPPAARRIVITNNVNDPTINPDRVTQLAGLWLDHGADATVYDWPAELGVGHNMVDDQDVPPGALDGAFPILLQLLLADQVPG